VVGDRDVVRERLGGVGVAEDALQRGAAGGDVPDRRGRAAGRLGGERGESLGDLGSRVKDMTVLRCERAMYSG
jgi:hypothetical protein